MRGIPTSVEDSQRWRLGRAICAVVGEDWTGSNPPVHNWNKCYLVFFAGGSDPKSAIGGSDTLIVSLNTITGGLQVKYINGSIHKGANMTPTRAAHIGLLRGLRTCQRHERGPVHVVGDNAVVIRQYATRTPPGAKSISGSYWKNRRMADAIGVRSWTSQPREYNRTSHKLAQVARTTGADAEWAEHQGPALGQKWAAITNNAPRDTAEWRQQHRAQDSSDSDMPTV
ncbi:hypothetical protein PF002_g31341 [Phytophthora fragariae]|uniref:RNase H type-1 domain-containing protein n=1 Tax=Phytophthora fragariae TaxID=53985 RepID=A0A6A3VGL7_9STRA|nr:hypothetical protein PF002_g31341 [Phytophthora fragariae]